MGVEEIKKFIPHRYPFLLVDRIIEYHPGERIIGLKNISYNDPQLQGHFPGNPVMPGVLQIEALAQTSAVYGKLVQPDAEGCLLTEVTSARFRRQVVPGDTMILDCRVEKQRKSFFWFEGEVRVQDDVAAVIKFSAKLG
jgi:3-hydroxyacyl-[acyl-carrier-protein] dehydratase